MINALNNINTSHNFIKTKTKDNLSFCGITKDFERKIYPDYETLSALYNVRKSSITGNLPKEMIHKIKESSTSKEEIQKKVKDVYNSFAITCSKLRTGEIIISSILDDIVDKKYIATMNKLLKKDSLDEYAKFYNETFGYRAIGRKKLLEIQKSAAKILEDSMKEAGIIPKKGKIEINYLGSGSFGHVFDISFLDEKNKKVIHNKVLKIYKNEKLDRDIGIAISKKDNELTNPNAKELDWDEVYDLGVDDELYNAHGCLAEANRALFLKKADGAINETNYIEPYFFNLRDEFALFETADSELPSVKRDINLEEYGLAHLDTENKENEKFGRIIDYGGITH